MCFLCLHFTCLVTVCTCSGEQPQRHSIFAGNGTSPKTNLETNWQPPDSGQRSGSTNVLPLGNPFGVEIAGDSVWITTVDDHCIWQTDLNRQQVRRVAGNGRSGYSGDGGDATAATMNWPHEVRVDNTGNLYVADTRNHVIRLIDADTQEISTVAGSGKAGFSGDGESGIRVSFNQPHSIALEGEGESPSLLVADTKNHRIRRIDLNTRIVTTIAGTGQKKLPRDGSVAIASPLFGPRSLAVDRQSIWVVLREGNSIWRIDRKHGTIHHVAGTGKKGYSGDGGQPLQATFRGPKGIDIDPGGNLLVVDTENHAIRKIDLSDNRIETVLGGSRSATTLRLKRPHGIAVKGQRILVGDSEQHRVVQMDASSDH